jgi:transposase
MPPRRQFGTEIAGNLPRGPNVRPDQRHRIIAKCQCGVSIAELVEEFGRSESAIKYTVRTYSARATTQEKSRSGHTPILSRHTKKLVLQKVCTEPKIEYSELAKVAQVYATNGTSSKLLSTQRAPEAWPNQSPLQKKT